MKRLIGIVAISAISLAGALGTVLSPAHASGTSSITDPVGDANPQAAAYQDVTSGSLIQDGTVFTFVQQVADAVPAAPQLPPSVILMSCCFGMDTNPATAPRGYPFPPGNANGLEYLACVLWDGTTFSGELIDRTPLLVGSGAVVTPIPFAVSGDQVSVSVEESLVGNASSFAWDAGTENRHSAIPSNGYQELDFAGPANWPA